MDAMLPTDISAINFHGRSDSLTTRFISNDSTMNCSEVPISQAKLRRLKANSCKATKMKDDIFEK